MKTIELYKYGIDYYGFSHGTIVLSHGFTRLDGIEKGDTVKIFCEEDDFTWIGEVEELTFNSITLKTNKKNGELQK